MRPLLTRSAAVWISGTVQTIFYCDFFYYYLKSWKNNERLKSACPLPLILLPTHPLQSRCEPDFLHRHTPRSLFPRVKSSCAADGAQEARLSYRRSRRQSSWRAGNCFVLSYKHKSPFSRMISEMAAGAGGGRGQAAPETLLS